MTILGLMLKPQRLFTKGMCGEETGSQLQNTKACITDVFGLPLPPPFWMRALEKMKIYFDCAIRNSMVIFFVIGLNVKETESLSGNR